MKKIAVIDNYDSFTYNLVHYLEDLGATITVFRNDEFEIEELNSFDKIVLSPGPGVPDEAGLLKKVIETYSFSKNILGICLGLQAIAEVFGSRLTNLSTPLHGISTEIKVIDPNEVLFDNLPLSIEVGHYHSWIVDSESLNENLKITSVDAENRIMSLRHTTLDVCGVQFHPESILTPHGKIILKNWLNH